MVSIVTRHEQAQPAPSAAIASGARRQSGTRYRLGLRAAALTFVLAGCQATPPLPLAGNPFIATEAPRPAVGDIFVYRFSDGYGSKESGQVVYRVDSIDSERTVMSVIPDVQREGVARTEVYGKDGNWLHIPLNNHDQPVDYEFAPAYPAYVFPLAPGKSWSMRVNATNAIVGRRSVRVDATVSGAERIRVPAGDFDTVRITRTVYAGDADYRPETRISEIDWYAPALGRPVRTERQAQWLDHKSACDGFAGCDRVVRGEWYVYELVSYPSSVR